MSQFSASNTVPSLRAVRGALAAHAYRTDKIRVIDRCVTGYSCLVASRQGLFAVAPAAAKLVAFGLFFGLRRHDDMLYLFETCDPSRGPSRMGRLLQMRIDRGRLCDEQVIATGLDNQCHQLAVIGTEVCIVDTANQAIVLIAGDGSTSATLFPFGNPVVDGYHHINSIAQADGHTLVLLHNAAGGRIGPSELAWLDRDWRVVRRETLPATGCHDIVQDEDGLLWHCASMDGALMNSAGLHCRVSAEMTRGLAFTEEAVIVGTSQFARREGRTRIGGHVLFLDRAMQRLAQVELSGAPTEIAAL
ncbi:hypothetical protein [Sphingomonas baiyangensis]|uniref:DUF4915 domain-containing protein n=1 Tax=Sphingomonas baiyangensis TaxID=2572576 RepID=A0A4U1L5R8_9SPHN|nr:hypothetical protein [Sphingomonas baiyangensis]TKD51575.1 hypothetical protein FBR43_13030 [Sphingomonas baiyangensis]